MMTAAAPRKEGKTDAMTDAIKDAIEHLTETIRKTPQFSSSVFRASSYSDTVDFTTRSEIRGFSVPMDEPRELGGNDTAPNPVEMLLAALGSCQEIVYRAFAAVLGIEILRIEVHAKGYLDLRGFLNLAEVPAGFTGVTYTTRIVSTEPTERIRQLTELVERHCPVYDTLRRPIEVKGKVEVARPGGEVEVVTSME